MKAKAFLFGFSTLLSIGAAHGQATVEIKPGLWEIHILKMAMDGKDWLESIRAQTREAQARQAQVPSDQRRQIRDPLVEHLCMNSAIPKNWLNLQNAPGMPLDKKNMAGCTSSKVSQNGERVTSEMVCNKSKGNNSLTNEDEMIFKVKMEIIKTNETNMKIVMTNVTSKHTMVQEIQMRFLESNCGGLKSVDEEIDILQGHN